MKKMIIIGVAVLLIAGIAGGAFWFLNKEDPQEPADGVAAEEQTPEKVADPIYTSLDPEFIVAFQEPKNARFLKLAVEVMTRDDDVIDDIKLHMPAVRDAVVMLLSGVGEAGLFTAGGKEELREEILTAVQAVLEENTGKPGVEAVYFTNFVMQ